MIYKLPEIYDADGDINKQWFVFYSFRHPQTYKFQRFKVYKDLNTFKTRSERYEYAKLIKVALKSWLEEGGSPYESIDDRIAEQEQNIIHCINEFNKFVDNGELRDNYKYKLKNELRIFSEYLVASHLDHLKIGEIKKQHIFEFVEAIKKRPNIKSGKTVNHYLNDIRRFFNHFIHNYDDYLVRNPAATITRANTIEKGNIAFTEEELEHIRLYLELHDPYLWFVCQVIYYTGLRNEAELVELKCGDFDYKNKLFYVDAHVAKNKVRQAVPIYPEFEELLLSRKINKVNPDWYLFGRKDQPGPLRIGRNTYAIRFRVVKKDLGLHPQDHGMYCFKSTRACHLYDDGADIRDIQLLFRHSDLAVTIKYLKSLGRIERGRTFDKGRKL